MKIANMTKKELVDALSYLGQAPTKDKCFAGFNFDPATWEQQITEIVAAYIDIEMERTTKDGK